MCVIPGFPVIVVAWLRRGSDLVVTVVVVVWLRRGATCWFVAVVVWLAVQVMLDLPGRGSDDLARRPRLAPRC